MNIKFKVLSVLSSLCLCVSILLGIIFFLSFQHSFYSYEYEKNHQAEVIGMSDDDLMNATDTLLDYLEDKRDDIVVEATVNDDLREVFNERETLHMIDVKNLCFHAKTCAYLLFGISLIFAFGIYLKEKKKFFQYYEFGFQFALGILVLFISLLAIYALCDFYDFWMNFHYIFFDNDLFILDPNTSIMINMFPESFFFDLVILIMVVYVIVIGVLYFVIHHMKKVAL